MSVVPATVSSVATTVIALPEQATQKPSRARIFDVPRLGRVLLRRVPCRRWLWGLLWGGVELGLGFGELLEFAAVKKNAAATGALIDGHPEALHRQHLRHAPRTQQRRFVGLF